MAAWRYKISLLVLKKYFSTLEEKFRISARPCNILYIFRTKMSLVSVHPVTADLHFKVFIDLSCFC